MKDEENILNTAQDRGRIEAEELARLGEGTNNTRRFKIRIEIS
jgi:hypothetical protein